MTLVSPREGGGCKNENKIVFISYTIIRVVFGHVCPEGKGMSGVVLID